jgi:hypothetical protein
MFFFTTAGWMMWNFLVSSPLLGVCPVLYDGNPGYPDPGVLWQVAEEAQVSLFGASPAYVDIMSRAGIVPGKSYDLSRLREILLAGSPVSAACGAWFYRNVSVTCGWRREAAARTSAPGSSAAFPRCPCTPARSRLPPGRRGARVQRARRGRRR